MNKIIVAIPCLNEEKTIRQVVIAFQNALPEAELHVFDNGSTDNSVALALSAGAEVHVVERRGKGAVVQEMFRRCHAEVVLMVDGDATYPPEKARELVDAVLRGEADMASGTRLHRDSRSAFRCWNRWGNYLFRVIVNRLFRSNITDLLTGYRAFSRRFIASVRPASVGFEIETELTLRAIEQRLKMVEIPVHLQARPEDSHSKIRVIADGFRILRAIWSHRLTERSSWVSSPAAASS